MFWVCSVIKGATPLKFVLSKTDLHEHSLRIISRLSFEKCYERVVQNYMHVTIKLTMSEILNSYAGKLPTFLQQKGCVHFAEILQNCVVCQFFGRMCSVVFHAFTLKLPIKILPSVAPNLPVSARPDKKSRNSRKRVLGCARFAEILTFY